MFKSLRKKSFDKFHKSTTEEKPSKPKPTPTKTTSPDKISPYKTQPQGPQTHPELRAAIVEAEKYSRSHENTAQRQHAVIQRLLRWSADQENVAIRDIVHQYSELSHLWLNEETDFTKHFKKFYDTLKMIAEDEDKWLRTKSTHERTIKQCQVDLAQAASLNRRRNAPQPNSATVAEKKLSEEFEEFEAVKLIRFKSALCELSDAYEEYAFKLSAVSSAQTHLSSLLPNVVGTTSVRMMRYDDYQESNLIVQNARKMLERAPCRFKRNHHRRTSEPLPRRAVTSCGCESDDCCSGGEDDSPPPYTTFCNDQSSVATTLTSKQEENANLQQRFANFTLSTTVTATSSSPPPPFNPHPNYNTLYPSLKSFQS